jgi:hypothetical protein
MGVDLLLNIVAIPLAQEPDWSAADARIKALRLDEFAAYFTYWSCDEELQAEQLADPDFLARTQEELLRDLNGFCKAVTGYHRELISFDFNSFRFFVTGGLSAGQVPTELYDPTSSLWSVGALAAAGFVPVAVDQGG